MGSFDEERIIMPLIFQFWSKSTGLPILSPPPLLYLTVDVPVSISRAWLLLVEGWPNLHLADFCETMVQMPKYIVQGAFMVPPYPWVLLSNMATTCVFPILSCPCGMSISLPSLCRLHKENEWLSSCHHSIDCSSTTGGWCNIRNASVPTSKWREHNDHSRHLELKWHTDNNVDMCFLPF